MSLSPKAKYVLAFVAVTLFGGITIFRVSPPELKLDWAIIRDIISAKLRIVAVGDCNLVYDRDTGQLVEKVCKPMLDLQPTVDQLRKELQDAQREASKVPQLQIEVVRQRSAAEEAISKLRKQLEENATLKKQYEDQMTRLEWVPRLMLGWNCLKEGRLASTSYEFEYDSPQKACRMTYRRALHNGSTGDRNYIGFDCTDEDTRARAIDQCLAVVRSR